jgi:hypothetical protein
MSFSQGAVGVAFDHTFVVVTTKAGVAPLPWKRYEVRSGTLLVQRIFILFWMTLMTAGFALVLRQSHER